MSIENCLFVCGSCGEQCHSRSEGVKIVITCNYCKKNIEEILKRIRELDNSLSKMEGRNA